MESCHTINKYKIILVPVKNSNVIYVQSYILSGRMNETKETSGISHLLEHVLTESWSKCKNNCAKYWGEKGIITNASTSDTILNYYIEGLYKYHVDILNYIIHITTNPQIYQGRIAVEKKAVKEELIRDMNDPSWKMSLQLSKCFYNHEGLINSGNIPLQIKNLRKINFNKLDNFCKKVYTPTNILFVVSGHFNKTTVLNIFRNSLPKKKCPGLPNIINNSRKIISSPKTYFIPNKQSKVAEIVIAFSSPIFPWSKECLLFKSIADILSDGMISLFMKKLRSELHLIYNIQVYIDSNVTGTQATIETTGDEENIKQILDAIFEVLNDFLKGNFDDDQISRVKEMYMIREDSICKNTTFWGDFYGSQYINQMYKPTPKIYKYNEITKIIHNFTKKDIVNVANKIFDVNKAITIYQSKRKI